SAAFSASVFAADKPFYVAADYGKLAMSPSTGFGDPGAIRVAGGYHFNPNFAVEAGLMAVGDSTLNDSTGSVTYAQSSLQASGVIFLPLGDKFKLFGKLGVASNYGKMTGTGSYSTVDASTTTTNAMYGIGGQFNFTQLVGMRVQYEKFGKSKAASSAPGVDLARFSAGVVFSF
ncbi:MAG: outer membrane beta-barrel protein, partial [Burkholderiales bacterium]|nr:outer membrane beta-barrel protein [Burkholderiales bacterium]